MQQLYSGGRNDELIKALLVAGVRFLVVGGLAVQFYCPSRQADDLDLLLEQTPKNAGCLFKALKSIGLEPGFSRDVIAKGGPRPQHLPLKQHNFYTDLITQPDLDFPTEWNQAIEGLIWQSRVRFASRAFLLELKGESFRPKDLADVALLTEHCRS